MNYFISFSYKNGFGNAMLTMEKPIKDMDGILEVQKYIEKKQNIKNVIVLNFKLMEGKQMKVYCDIKDCEHNVDGRCSNETISINIDGYCESEESE